MNSRFFIRKSQLKDLALLPEIERAASVLFKNTPFFIAVSKDVTTIEDFKEAHVDNLLWVAEADGRAVGFAFVEMLEKSAHLDELDVHPDFMQRGIGKALVKTVCSWADKNKIPAITLTTYKGIVWNELFYAKMGFEILPFNELFLELKNLVELEDNDGLLLEDRVVMIYRTNLKENM